MSISVTWSDSARTIIFQEFSGEWGEEEFIKGVHTIHDMIESRPYPVDLLMHFRPDQVMHPHIFTLMSNHTEGNVHPRQRFVIAITTSQVVMTVAATATRFLPKTMNNSFFVPTVEEAFKKLEELRRLT